MSCELAPTPKTCSNHSQTASSFSSVVVSWKAQKNSALFFSGSAFRGEQPLTHRGQWRRRRNSLVAVTKHLNTSTKK